MIVSGVPKVEGLTDAAGRLKQDPRVRVQLARVIESLDDPDGVISAFQSFASDR